LDVDDVAIMESDQTIADQGWAKNEEVKIQTANGGREGEVLDENRRTVVYLFGVVWAEPGGLAG
jgi:hypothetical protein